MDRLENEHSSSSGGPLAFITDKLLDFNNILRCGLHLRYHNLLYLVISLEKMWLGSVNQMSFVQPDDLFEIFEALLFFLEASLIPEAHQSHLLINIEVVVFLNNMVQMLTTVGTLNELGVQLRERRSEAQCRCSSAG